MKENLQIAVNFAEKIKNIKGVVQIILFGSVATGEDNERSDIDIAVIHNIKEKFKITKEVNKFKPEKVQTTLLNLKDLPKETELVGALSGEGILLYGNPIIIRENKLDLNAKILLPYSLKNLKQTDKVKLNRALYGSISRVIKSNKEYKTVTKGLVKEPGIEKINDGVLLVDRKKSMKLINLFKRFNVEFKEIAVWTY